MCVCVCVRERERERDYVHFILKQELYLHQYLKFILFQGIHNIINLLSTSYISFLFSNRIQILSLFIDLFFCFFDHLFSFSRAKTTKVHTLHRTVVSTVYWVRLQLPHLVQCSHKEYTPHGSAWPFDSQDLRRWHHYYIIPNHTILAIDTSIL